IKRLAKTHDGSGIVYASRRKAVEQVTSQLRELGLSASAYHAGLSDSARVKAQEEFMGGRTQMIVATNAFGMGIDKPDIRFVAHYQMPGSIEAYYQEIGRAGRDGLPSSCLLLFNYADKNTHDFFIEGSYPTPELARSIYEALVATGLKRIELSAAELAKRAGARNEMAVQSSLYLLERAGHIARAAPDNRSAPGEPSPWEPSRGVTGRALTGTAAVSPALATSDSSTISQRRRARAILMLDAVPATKLRIDSSDVSRRAALERRKLREMIEFCYTEYCYRAHILDYFGDRHHVRQCGSCGNCSPNSVARAPLSEAEVISDAPVVVRNRRKGATQVISARALSVDENLRVRKILAGAARMKGRFGKSLLAASLRGSAAKNVLQGHLNQLSTYGLLKDMRQEDIMLYIEALQVAGCLHVSGGAYPTISITELGERVMREQERIELALGDDPVPDEDEGILPHTTLQTFTLFSNGLSVAEIASQRGLVTNTIEGHLIECISSGLAVEISRLVSDSDRAQIEKAITDNGTEQLKPIRESLPESITYNMIRVVVAGRGRGGK
ncbi:MAG TPA: helix-turn-helix domain-containing protein, partial [Pyrinomonadaceae bacterium]|nr:helix-turn-helix domain-containing protein [Pyrinomonadaceae bacterium]